jgi:hypothetical protein
MKISLKSTLLLLFCFTFSSCSWTEYFVVVNASSSEIMVNYQLSDAKLGYGIFGDVPEANKLDVSGEIVFNQPVKLIDLDTSKLGVSVKIPPKTTLQMGYLRNDTYKKYNQKFINGHFFNLQKIEIKTDQKSVTILQNQFDKFFKKSEGVIAYKVK